jgi:hypothetical protein
LSRHLHKYSWIQLLEYSSHFSHFFSPTCASPIIILRTCSVLGLCCDVPRLCDSLILCSLNFFLTRLRKITLVDLSLRDFSSVISRRDSLTFYVLRFTFVTVPVELVFSQSIFTFPNLNYNISDINFEYCACIFFTSVCLGLPRFAFIR